MLDVPPSVQRYGLRVASIERDQLGEAPVWEDRSGTLLRVDIARGRVLGLRVPLEPSAIMELNGEVSAAIPRFGGGLLLAIGHEIVALDAQRERQTLAIVEDHKPDNRFNDCRCDPQGHLWAGTMSKKRTPGAAALYRLVPGRPIERVLPDTTLSNGMGWSPDGELMYFIDSTTQQIDTFDFDPDDSSISNRRRFASVDPADGLPDGLTVDAEGAVWICLFGGGSIRRYGPDGDLQDVIRLPVTNPTCPTFGGTDLRTLYITSARHRLRPEQLAREPLAGAVLALEPGVRGQPLNRFAG